MMMVRLLIGVMWVLAAVAGHEMWTAPVTAVQRAANTSISMPMVQEVTDTGERYAQPQVDVYGNEIDEALGDYRVDPRGEMFERHSPDTALLKLGPPGV